MAVKAVKDVMAIKAQAPFRLALLLGAGLFVGTPLLTQASEGVWKTESKKESWFPEIVFGWQRGSAKEERGWNLPKISFGWQKGAATQRSVEAKTLEAEELIDEIADRVRLERITDPALAPDQTRPYAQNFERRYLRPLDSFILPAKRGTDFPEPAEGSVLTLRDTLFHALSANSSIVLKDLQTVLEAERVTQAESVFIPTYELSSDWSQSRFPQNASEASANNFLPVSGDPRIFVSKTGILEAALKGETPQTTQYEFYTNLRYNESTLTRTSRSAAYEEEYTFNVGVRLTQPLLRGSDRQIREAPIRIARINRKIASNDLRTELNQLALDTLEAYFQWMEASEIKSLREWEAKTYGQVADIIRRKVETGDAGQRDLLRVDIRLARIQDRILQAEETLAQTRHRVFGNFANSFPFKKFESARPAGELSPLVPELDTSAVTELAVARSSQLAAIRHKMDIDRENLRVAIDERRASLNLVAGVEARGLAGEPFETYGYISDRHPVGYNVGLIYSRPWDNRAAESKVREARIKLRQSEAELAQAERSIRHRIQGEIERLERTRTRILATEKLQMNVAKEIEIESKLLETGETSLSALLEFYEELFAIRVQALGALTELNIAKARIRSADDSLLESLGLEYDEYTP